MENCEKPQILPLWANNGHMNDERLFAAGVVDRCIHSQATEQRRGRVLP